MYIFPEFQYCFDGTFAILKMLEIMAEEKMTLSQLKSDIDEYSRVEFSVDCPNELKDAVIQRLVKYFRDKEPELCDGIRVEEPSCFMLIRASRFEPALRIYIESESSEKTQNKALDILKLIETLMGDMND